MVKSKTKAPRRCPWSGKDETYVRYHDEEWGVPCRDDAELFELLVLEGMQAGLAWITILRKRRNIREELMLDAPEKLARFKPARIERALRNEGIIRHRGKVEAAVTNARAFLELQRGEGFAEFLWSFVGGTPLQNRWRSLSQVPSATEESKAMSKALKKLGFGFVGPTTCYAFMQSAGMVNDHLTGCFRHPEVKQRGVRRCRID